MQNICVNEQVEKFSTFKHTFSAQKDKVYVESSLASLLLTGTQLTLESVLDEGSWNYNKNTLVSQAGTLSVHETNVLCEQGSSIVPSWH